jgi:hypothetical protein
MSLELLTATLGIMFVAVWCLATDFAVANQRS